MPHFKPNQRIRVYYNNVDVDKRIVRKNCPYTEERWTDAIEYADKMVEQGTWSGYIIPDLSIRKVIFQDEDDRTDLPAGKLPEIKCSCGNSEELENIEGLQNFYYSTTMNDVMYFLCKDCMNEVELESE